MSDPFIAEIIMFGSNFNPRGWAYCNGALLSISSNTALFSLLGTTYGGDGRTTFGLPDLRGRVPVGSEGGSAGPGLSPRPLGQKSGQESVVLSTAQMPSHTHTNAIKASSGAPDESNPIGGYPAVLTNSTEGYAESSNGTMAAGGVTIENTGGSQAHNNMPPFLAINFIIALVGTFPSRN